MFRCGYRLMVSRTLGGNINHRVHRKIINQSCKLSRTLCDPPTRSFSKVADNPFTELYFEEVFEFGLREEDPLNDLRYYLYPSSNDPAILALASAASVQTVLDIISDLNEPTIEQLTQAVATLEHLQKLCNFIDGANYGDEYRGNFRKFNEQLRESAGYQKLCQQIVNNMDKFDLTKLAFIMMSMRRFIEPLSSVMMQKIFIRLRRNILELDIQGLSYFSVAMRSRFLSLYNEMDSGREDSYSRHNLVWRLALAPALPNLESCLKECETAEDLRKIAIVFNSLSGIISERLMNLLAEKVKDFIRENKFEGSVGLGAVCKLLSVVINKIGWHEENGDYVALLLQQVQGRTMYLRPVQALLVAKISSIFGEPAQVYYDVYHRLCQVMETQEYLSGSVPAINCLSYILQINVHSIPKEKVEKILIELIDGPHFSDHMTDVFDILKSVGVCNKDIADKFFKKSMDIVKDDSANLVRLGIRYTNMYSIYGGLYKNENFEKELFEILLSQIENTTNPQAFAAEFSLLLSYSSEKLSDHIMNRFHAMIAQMKPVSLYVIARGLETKMKEFGQSRKGHWQNAMAEGTPRHEQNKIMEQVEDISVSINNVSLYMLNEKNLTLNDLSFVFRNFTCRRSVIEESFFDYLTDAIKLQMDSNKVSARFIRHLCSSIEALKPPREIPELTDRFLNFFISRPDKMTHMKVLHKVIRLCYISNHQPPQKFLSILSSCLIRDLDALPGRHVLDTCMFLALFRALDKETVEAVFSNEFMAKLDKEMDMCGKKTNYPIKLRETLMFLNRAVVIDYPEYGVPWFHENFCKEHSPWLGKQAPDASQLRTEVYSVLCDMLGGWKFVKENSVSKYYNKVDFEVVLDQAGQPVNLYQDQPLPDGSVKYAVQCYDQSKFTQDTRRLCGHEVLESRQLEAQDWQVVRINPFSWNSLKMGEIKAKTEYLETEMRAVRSSQ